MKAKKTMANKLISRRPREAKVPLGQGTDYYQIGDRIAYAYNSVLTFGYILRFEPAPDGMLVVVTQDKFLNHTGRPILRRPDQILSVEE